LILNETYVQNVSRTEKILKNNTNNDTDPENLELEEVAGEEKKIPKVTRDQK